MSTPAAVHPHRFVNPFTFGVVIFGLLLLTGASYGLSYVELAPSWELTFSLTFAVAKAILVALFFMRLIDEAPSNQIAFITAVLFVAILIIFIVADVVARSERPTLVQPQTGALVQPMATPPGPASATPSP